MPQKKYPDYNVIETAELSIGTNVAGDIIVGNQGFAGGLYTGATASALADATTGGGDIDTPGAWTDILDIVDGPMLVGILDYQNIASGGLLYPPLYLGNALIADLKIRVQINVDGVAMLDWKQTASSVAFRGGFVVPVMCYSRFQVRASRVGTSLSTTATLVIGPIIYQKPR